MAELYVSAKFDMEDIRRIREFNSQRHREMPAKELQAEFDQSTKLFLKKMEMLKTRPSA